MCAEYSRALPLFRRLSCDQESFIFWRKKTTNNNEILFMDTTVTLDSEIVQAIQQATKQKDKTSAVHMALNEYLRLQKLRQLARLAGTVELRYSNDGLEAMEEC